MLQILLEHAGDLVTREELQSRIWPEDSFGEFDHAVNVAVGKLRAALDDSAENPSFIETVPRRGYRFVARLYEGPVDTHPQLPAINGVLPSKLVSGLCVYRWKQSPVNVYRLNVLRSNPQVRLATIRPESCWQLATCQDRMTV